MCYYIKGLCAATNRNFDDSYQFFNRTREILDNNPKIKADSGQRYVMTLSHLLRCYIDGKNFEKAQALIQDLRGLEGTKGFNSTDITVRIFTNTYNLELALLHAMGEYQKSVELIPKIEQLQNSFGDKVSKEQEILLTYNKANSYFGIGDFKKALYNINLVLNDNEQNLRQDIYSFSRLLNLVIHYELENFDFLEYVIKSTNRYFSKQERGYEVEAVCIKYIRRLAKSITLMEKHSELQALRDELNELLKDRNEQVVLEYFNITAWVESKIRRISMSDAVKELLKK
jgi:tetratricopeptide (TPR) repeat protein